MPRAKRVELLAAKHGCMVSVAHLVAQFVVHVETLGEVHLFLPCTCINRCPVKPGRENCMHRADPKVECDQCSAHRSAAFNTGSSGNIQNGLELCVHKQFRCTCYGSL